MAIPEGTHRLGPQNGTLSVRTGRTGAAAKAGHDLLLHVTAWEATLDAGGDPAIAVDVDASSLRVIEGTGGMQALGDDDRASIVQTIDEEVLQRQPIRFRSTAVQAGGDGFAVQGELTMGGRTGPIAFEVALGAGGRLSASAVVRQSDWGIKPYSALFGALKVADEVAVALEATLPPQSA